MTLSYFIYFIFVSNMGKNLENIRSIRTHLYSSSLIKLYTYSFEIQPFCVRSPTCNQGDTHSLIVSKITPSWNHYLQNLSSNHFRQLSCKHGWKANKQKYDWGESLRDELLNNYNRILINLVNWIPKDSANLCHKFFC